MELGDILNKAKEKAGHLKDAAVKQGQIYEEEIAKLTEATNVGTEKLKAIFSLVSNASSLIAEAGYELDEIEVELGVPPKLIPHFKFTSAITQEKKQELLEKTREDKLMNLLLKSLFTATALQSTMRMGNFRMVEVEIEIGLVPSVRLRFSKQGTGSSIPLIE